MERCVTAHLRTGPREGMCYAAPENRPLVVAHLVALVRCRYRRGFSSRLSSGLLGTFPNFHESVRATGRRNPKSRRSRRRPRRTATASKRTGMRPDPPSRAAT